MRRILLAMSLLVSFGCGNDTSSTDTPDTGAANLRPAPDVGSTNTVTPDASTVPDSGDAGNVPDLAGDECGSDFDCSDDIFCNGVERCFDGFCFASPTVQCEDLSDCTADVCDEENQRCEFVPDDTLCAPGQVCRSKGGCFTPAACAVDADCDDGLLCNGIERCAGSECQPGEPVECSDGIGCTNDVCVEGTGTCQSVADHSQCLAAELCLLGAGCAPRPPCVRDDDCDDGLFCNGRETCGPDDVCIPGTPPTAVDSVPCTIDQCDESLNMVINTPDNARCADGVFCNGVEVCHPLNGCGPGVPPALSDGLACTTDTCNEALRLVEHTPDDAICDDGLFCNGTELCHPIDGCSPGEPPILNDGVGCTIDTCSEVQDAVLHVADDGLCDDGLFCNGLEVCDEVMDCQTTMVPVVDDGVLCTVDSCDESADVVVNVPDDSLCGSGNMCVNPEVCDATQGCMMGPPVVIDDNIACTIDACDAVTGVSHTPDDSECDDGMFCNGVETCDATSGCAAGTNPADDQNPCTQDLCDEGNDTVSNPPAANGTVCGSSPRSICVGGGCQPSVCGDNQVDGGNGEQCDDGNTNNGDGCSSSCQNEVASCDPDGTYVLSPQVAGTCAGGLANWNATVFTFSSNGAIVSGLTTGLFPTARTMTGSATSCPSGSFSVGVTIPGGAGGCTETYTLTGTFTGNDTWSGQFSGMFSGACLGCTDFSDSISGTR